MFCYGEDFMISIISSQNPLIKEVKSLKSRKDREAKGLFFVEGSRIVEEAANENTDIKYTVISEDYASGDEGRRLSGILEKSGCRNYMVPDGLYKQLTDTETPQGILAVIGLGERRTIDDTGSDDLYVILENIRDPGNMGTIMRTADAAGFTGVIVSSGCVDVYNTKVLRATMGSIFHIPVYYCSTAPDAVRLLKSKGIKVYASHLKGSCSLYEADMTVPASIVIGSEAEGVSEETALSADMLIRIPMPGRAESLNASVAAGIMMYEAVRQRCTKCLQR